MKYCTNCGNQLNENGVCPVCSAIQVQSNQVSSNIGPTSQTSGISKNAIASLLCGIGGLIIAGFPLGLTAFGLGLVSIREIKANSELKGVGLAIAGIALGIADIVLVSIYLMNK